MNKILLTVCALALSPIFYLNAQSVDILWQGETYTPPFYEGRALWSAQSDITLVAITQGLGSPESLYYKWSQNGTVLGLVSGTGQNTLRMSDTVFSPAQEIKIEIVSPEKEILAQSAVVIAPKPASTLIYEKNPLYGYLFHKEAGEIFRIREGEVSLSAFPLFSPKKSREEGEVNYRWSSNTGEIATGHTVTYRAPEESAGSSQVMLKILFPGKLLEDISRNFLIQFGNE